MSKRVLKRCGSLLSELENQINCKDKVTNWRIEAMIKQMESLIEENQMLEEKVKKCTERGVEVDKQLLIALSQLNDLQNMKQDLSPRAELNIEEPEYVNLHPHTDEIEIISTENIMNKAQEFRADFRQNTKSFLKDTQVIATLK